MKPVIFREQKKAIDNGLLDEQAMIIAKFKSYNGRYLDSASLQ